MLVCLEYREKYSLAVAYFMTFCVSLHQCSGCLETRGSHTQITHKPQFMPFFQVQTHHYKKYAPRFVRSVLLGTKLQHHLTTIAAGK